MGIRRIALAGALGLGLVLGGAARAEGPGKAPAAKAKTKAKAKKAKPAPAAEAPGRRDAVFVNGGGFAHGFGALGWEHGFKGGSLVLEGLYSQVTGSDWRLRYGGAAVAARAYPWSAEPLQGFYIGPKACLLTLDVGYDTQAGPGASGCTSLGVGAELGWQWLPARHWGLALGGEALALQGALDLPSLAPSIPIKGPIYGLVADVLYAF